MKGGRGEVREREANAKGADRMNRARLSGMGRKRIGADTSNEETAPKRGLQMGDAKREQQIGKSHRRAGKKQKKSARTATRTLVIACECRQ